jgi:hypothetical protein
VGTSPGTTFNPPRTARQDPVDLRDAYYTPSLQPLRHELFPPDKLLILNQHTEGACTGFALSAAIEMFRRRRAASEKAMGIKTKDIFDEDHCASPRMLYEMAKLHDEIQEPNQSGSTIRGALKGFFHNGVCIQELAPYIPNAEGPWTLELTQARDARNLTLGAYYRLRPAMSDYHAVLNECGAIIASAVVHDGWLANNLRGGAKPPEEPGVIKFTPSFAGRHAFVIVGYDAKGFIIQNSWGEAWGGFKGRPGLAHWCYDDWAENIMDAWVLQVGVSTPSAFHLTHTLVRPNFVGAQAAPVVSQIRRQDVIGHLIHLDDGKLVKTGRYATPISSLRATALYLAAKGNGAIAAPNNELTDPSASLLAPEKFRHILFFAHGSLSGPEVGARRVSTMKEVFKRNGIYPVHLMWETGLTDTVFDALKAVYARAVERVGKQAEELDRSIENMARGLGTKVWRAIKADAQHAFAKATSDGYAAFREVINANDLLRSDGEVAIINRDRAREGKPPLPPYKIHFAGHSAGSILVGECLKQWAAQEGAAARAENCFLLAPACTLDFYETHFQPLIEGDNIGKIVQYSLDDNLEEADSLDVYGKSMLNLVSYAFEERRGKSLLGLERSHKTPKWRKLRPSEDRYVTYYSREGSHRYTTARSHYEFPADLPTLNHMLKTILGEKPKPGKEFTAADLIGL